MRSSSVLVLLLLHQVLADEFTEVVTKASNEFASKLYQEVAKEEPGNVLVCPFSAHVALTLVHQGAGGNTAGELSTVLQLHGNNVTIKENYESLLSGIQDNVLTVATKLFPADGYQIYEDYINLARKYFLSDVENTDFTSPTTAANKINKYVEEKTNNKIHDLISSDSLSERTKLVIINAVHFLSKWKKEFPKAHEGTFKVSAQRKVASQMMTQSGLFEYKEDAALCSQVLKMDYMDEGYSMIFILPVQEEGLAALESKMANTSLDDILKDLNPRQVRVTIPKFKLEQTHNLNSVLINMGVKDLFSSGADLSQIASGNDLYVSEVVQKTFMRVDEEGTEAAAATGVVIKTKSAHKISQEIRFTADRPFLFKLIHNNLVIFEGRILDTSGL